MIRKQKTLKLPFSGAGRGIGGSVKFIGGSTGGSLTSGSSSISSNSSISKIKILTFTQTMNTKSPY